MQLKHLIAVLFATFLSSGCDGKSESPDADDDTTIDTVADTGADVIDDTITDGVSDPDAGDVETDSGECPRDRIVGQECEVDCQCESDLVCRGLPGALVCTVECETSAECTAEVMGCVNAVCELSTCGCRCSCSVDGECEDGICARMWCAGCANDEDCAEHACSDGEPRCRLDTQECVCSGSCGDGTCDPDEQGHGSCPADCTGPCEDGEVLTRTCMTGTRVQWCVCESSAWVCDDDPELLCPGETECAKRGGMCNSGTECYEGVLSAEPLGCGVDEPICCLPAECTTAGNEYYPYLGMCCPGLTTITSQMPMENFEGTGISCVYGCWALTCAPCGDGSCQPHLGENPCNCPEDCPSSPCDMVCNLADEDCGKPFCRQDGDVCHEQIPRCVDTSCTLETADLSGQVCNLDTRRCEAG